MLVPALAPVSPAQRLVAEGRLLAGFLDEQSAANLADFVRAPLPVQNAIREKFGAAQADGERDSPTPVLRHVDEPEAVQMLAGVARECGGPTVLHNLVGFEWVTIDSIVAGHYVAAPMPAAGRFPASAATLTELARFCVFGSAVPAQDLIVTGTGDLISPERLRLTMTGLQFRPKALSVDYVIEMPPSPITVLLLDHRLIAIRHQERLVALREASVREALCQVCYGYGIDALGSLPTVAAALVTSNRPPLISDFSNDAVTVTIAVPTPRTLLRFSHTVVDMVPPA